jgi:hypothetical protein
VLSLIDLLARDNSCDVGYYWLYHVPLILSFNGDARFLCLKRNKEDTVESFLKRPIKLDSIVRDYTKEGFASYHDAYYLTAENYERQYPDSFKVFNMQALNSLEGQEEMLKFLGIESPNYEIGVDLK